MEGVHETVEEIFRSIKFWLQHVSSKPKKEQALSQSEKLLLRHFDITPMVSRERPCRIVKWAKPAIGRVKLNVDGSCSGNPGMAGGGGVVRDDMGRLAAGFSPFFGDGSNNEAELRALMMD
ncbi:unnamed protein product [Fraxinus pennsylvanica]|uniref:RNase H type-1 domain-containing protein n=1 Tax=Fraxinus pennsylvanica TaxID=56036 RepID=A0AAD2A867_9LAMI|nr:unnamed protein product [Fraxinus pennsylvanica]